uniref:Putative rapid alkalinization factor 1 n=1 Tax=Davidia involucrata TaxID=16924 RepID=A0A5B7BL57_DAVIN
MTPHNHQKNLTFTAHTHSNLTSRSTNPTKTREKLPSNKMPKTKLHPMNTLFLALLFLHTHFTICNGVSVLGFNSLKTTELLDVMARRVCSGKIGECSEMAEETEMDSESNRRVLVMQKKFISYGTLKKDMIPCDRPGASYYNCRATGKANPYTRGCEVITGCARDISDIKY